ncbi:hypothetical protein ES703_17278 [subsurface metagenome]
MADIVGIEITKPLPEKAVVDSTYRTEGSVKLFDAVGAPPFVYAKVRRKEWYKPEIAEEVSYERGWPVPGTGDFSIEFKPEKEGEYKVSIVATPAPLALPVAGVFPILAESDVMEVSVGEKPPAVFRFAGATIDGNSIPLTDHDVDSGLLIQKKTTDFLEIIPAFEWVGPKKSATISIKAGYRDWAGAFSPKTDAYTRTFELPESPDIPYSGKLEEPIKIPLTACSDIGDGAIEIVAKLPDMPDYITRIWNVYATKPPVVAFRFASITIDGNEVPLTNHDADSGLLLEKTTADHLDVTPAFEWQGPRKTAKISIKAGYKDWMGAFSPKTGAYTRTIELPESIETIYPGQLTSPIAVPLTACGGLTDGAIEVVLKIADVPDYITHIWNVYSTKVAEEADIQDFDFKLTKGTYNIGDKVPFTAAYDYKGIAQDGQLTISIGTGVYPTFNTVYTYPAKPVTFAEAADWLTRGLEGSITLPGVLEPGQTYSVRAKLETLTVPTQETDTDWSAFDIEKAIELETLEVDITPSEGGYVTTDPAPEIGPSKWYDGSTGKFEYGTRVRVTAHPNEGYEFEKWSDEIEGGVSYSNPAYVSGTMTSHKAVKCHFEKVVVEEYTLTVNVDPYGGGTVTKSPDKTRYAKGEYVYLTANPASDFDFDYWSGDASGYSTSISVYMSSDKSVTAHFKEKLPDVGDIVNFSMRGDGFPFNTRSWMVYYYDPNGVMWTDGIQHDPGDTIWFYSVPTGGYMSCHCEVCPLIGTCEWSEQKYSNYFLAVTNGHYKYDIASGKIFIV